MDINHHYWEENSNIQQLKYERCNDMENGEFHMNSCNSNDAEHSRLKDEPLLPYRLCDSNLNFATVACSEDDSEYSQYKKNKVSRQDPMSHRIIEKRRRDRMNNCLADLSRLIPTDYLKKGRGRIEKTEIIEMAIRHIKNLQQAHRSSGREDAERSYSHEQYRLGYQECMSETMRFLVEVEGYFAREALCVRLISHLQKHCDALLVREKRVSSSANVPMEKEYMQGQAVPTAAAGSAGMSNGSLRSQSPGRPLSEHYDNASQLRDMLTCSMVKDEVRVPLSPQLMRPTSREDVVMAAAAVAPRLPSPCPDKHPEVADSGSATTGALAPKSPGTSDRARNMSETESYTNGVSLYKFKNNIKQRFSRDLNAENNQCKLNKRRKVIDSGRRNSVTTETYSSENHSSPIDSSQCSPPSSEMYRISSESENARISPTGSSVSDVRNIDTRTPTRYMPLKGDSVSAKAAAAAAVCYDRFSPTPKPAYPLKGGLPLTHAPDADKANYGVPIFALHAKGSFYVPLTIDYHILAPYLHHHNVFLDMLPNVHNIILHPVNINVNFQTGYFNTASTPLSKNHTKHKLDGQNAWH